MPFFARCFPDVGHGPGDGSALLEGIGLYYSPRRACEEFRPQLVLPPPPVEVESDGRVHARLLKNLVVLFLVFREADRRDQRLAHTPMPGSRFRVKVQAQLRNMAGTWIECVEHAFHVLIPRRVSSHSGVGSVLRERTLGKGLALVWWSASNVACVAV